MQKQNGSGEVIAKLIILNAIHCLDKLNIYTIQSNLMFMSRLVTPLILNCAGIVGRGNSVTFEQTFAICLPGLIHVGSLDTGSEDVC